MKTIICVASLDEIPQNFEAPEGGEIVITGIGQVNAAMRLTEVLMGADGGVRVLNVGTCGAEEGDAGMVYRIGSITAGFQEELKHHAPKLIICEKSNCEPLYTSDYFITQASDSRLYGEAKLFDMESYALAKICNRYDIPFAAYKVISDSFTDPIKPLEWEERAKELQDTVALVIRTGLNEPFYVPTLPL